VLGVSYGPARFTDGLYGNTLRFTPITTSIVVCAK